MTDSPDENIKPQETTKMFESIGKILDSPPQMDTPNLQLHMEKFLLNKDLKLAEQLHRNSRLPPEIRTFSNKLIYTSKS